MTNEEINYELKLQIPDGYRWVEVGEVQNVEEWRTIHNYYWSKTHYYGKCFEQYKFITPIDQPEPDTVDVPIESAQYMFFRAPVTKEIVHLCDAPCIVGPDWAFAGFVWGEDGPEIQNYYLVYGDRVKYAKAVRFRRVGGAK